MQTRSIPNMPGNGLGWILVFLFLSAKADPTKPLAWWPGENSTAGSQSRNLTWVGEPGYGEGRVGNAFHFHGTNYVMAQNAAWLDVSEFTFSAWINPSSYDGTVDIIVNREINPFQGDVGFEMGIRGTAEPDRNQVPVGNLLIYFGLQAGLPDNYQFWSDTGVSVPLGQWSHVAMTFKPGAVKVYFNGKIAKAWTIQERPLHNTGGPLRIGSRSEAVTFAYPYDGFNGRIDEPRFFGTALDEAAIETVRDAGPLDECCATIEMLVSPLGDITSDPRFSSHVRLKSVEVGELLSLQLTFTNTGSMTVRSANILWNWTSENFSPSLWTLRQPYVAGFGRRNLELSLTNLKAHASATYTLEWAIETDSPAVCCTEMSAALGSHEGFIELKAPKMVVATLPRYTPVEIGIRQMGPNTIVAEWTGKSGYFYQLELGRSDGPIIDWVPIGELRFGFDNSRFTSELPPLFSKEARFVRLRVIRN